MHCCCSINHRAHEAGLLDTYSRLIGGGGYSICFSTTRRLQFTAAWCACVGSGLVAMAMSAAFLSQHSAVLLLKLCTQHGSYWRNIMLVCARVQRSIRKAGCA